MRSRWAAGSVVERWTLWPSRARVQPGEWRQVVFPTPPLPIVMMTPCPWRVSSGMRESSGSERLFRHLLARQGGVVSAGDAGSFRARKAATPTRPKGKSGTSTRGRAARPPGSSWRANRPRASIATAVASAGRSRAKTPLTTSR